MYARIRFESSVLPCYVPITTIMNSVHRSLKYFESLKIPNESIYSEWAELIQPTIQLVEAGYPVSASLAEAVAYRAAEINETAGMR